MEKLHFDGFIYIIDYVCIMRAAKDVVCVCNALNNIKISRKEEFVKQSVYLITFSP